MRNFFKPTPPRDPRSLPTWDKTPEHLKPFKLRGYLHYLKLFKLRVARHQAKLRRFNVRDERDRNDPTYLAAMQEARRARYLKHKSSHAN